MVSLLSRLGLAVVAVLLSGYGRAPEGPGAHDQEFRDRASSADGIRWTGDGPSSSSDAGETAAFVDLFHFEDEPAHGSCPCWSDVDFALMRGDRAVLQLAMFHGRLVRGVPWGVGPRSEAALTDESARRVCRWFAEHRAPRPAEVVESYLARVEAGRARVKRTGELLAGGLRRELDAVPDDCYAGTTEAAILRKRLPASDERATLALRLIACYATAGYHGAVELLDRSPVEEMRDVLRRAGLDSETQCGADRWLLAPDHSRPVATALLDEFLRPAAARLLADARHRPHEVVLCGLRDIDHPVALDLLRELLEAPDIRDRQRAAEILVFSKEDRASFSRIRGLAPAFDEQYRDLVLDRIADLERLDGK